MNLIDFSQDFKGFLDNEDILLDTGIILGLLNEKSKWHTTIKALFDAHVFNNSKTLFLYINPTVLNEVTHLKERPLQEYLRRHPHEHMDSSEASKVAEEMISDIRQLIEDDILIVLDGNKTTALKQLEIYDALGSADAVNASIVESYGISFLTIDKKLADNMMSIEDKIPNVQNVYYTTAEHIQY